MINPDEIKFAAKLFIGSLKLKFGKYYTDIHCFNEPDNSNIILKIVQNSDSFRIFGITIDKVGNICYNNKPVGFYIGKK